MEGSGGKGKGAEWKGGEERREEGRGIKTPYECGLATDLCISNNL